MRFHVESPRQRTGSTHAQMTNFLLPDSCTTTTEDFLLCAPCVFPRSLISGHICVRVHLSHLSVYMRAPVCAALLVWVLSDAAARQFSEEEMAAVRYEHQLRLDSV